MWQYVRMLLVLVMLGMSNTEITEELIDVSPDDCIVDPFSPRTICLTESHCKDNCRGIPNMVCQKTNAKLVKNLLVLAKNKTGENGKLKLNSVVNDGFVCTLNGTIPAKEWPMITITSENGTGETREYYSDASCKNKCTFGCVESKSTKQIKSSLKNQNLKGLQLYECGSTPWWMWALGAVGILVLISLFVCVLCCCCCGFVCLACCGCCGSKAKTEKANTAQLESGTNVRAPSRAKTNVVTTSPRSPPHEHSRRSSRSGRSSRSSRSSHGSHHSHRSNRNDHSSSVSTHQSPHQSSRLESSNLSGPALARTPASP